MALLGGKRITLAFTSGPILPVIVDKLSEGMCSIQVYNPPEPALDLTKTIGDLQLSKKELNIEITTLWTDVQAFKPDIIIFLNLNVLPQCSDSDFFKAIHSQMAKIKIDFDLSMVLFGQNYRGLLAAAALIKASKCYNDDVSNHVKVISSIHYAGRKMYLDQNNSMVMAMRGGNLFINHDDGDEKDKDAPDADVHKKLEVLGGVWNNNDFVMLESEAIVEAVQKYLKDGSFEDIGLIGRFPTNKEMTELEMAEGTTWLPSKEDDVHQLKEVVIKNIRRLSVMVEEIRDNHVRDMSGGEESDEPM